MSHHVTQTSPADNAGKTATTNVVQLRSVSGFCLTGLFSQRSLQVREVPHEGLQEKNYGEAVLMARECFYGPDALPVTQPTVSKR